MLANREENERQKNINKLLIEAVKINNVKVLELFLTPSIKQFEKNKLIELGTEGYLSEIRVEIKTNNDNAFKAWERWVQESYLIKFVLNLIEQQKAGARITLDEFLKMATEIATKIMASYFKGIVETEYNKSKNDPEEFLSNEINSVEFYSENTKKNLLEYFNIRVKNKFNQYNYEEIIKLLVQILQSKTIENKVQENEFYTFLLELKKSRLNNKNLIHYLERLNKTVPVISAEDKLLIKNITSIEAEGEQLLSIALENNIEIDHVKDQDQATLLNIAASANNIKSVKVLLEKGANPFLKNNHGVSALENFSKHYEPYSGNEVFYEMLTKASNRITHDDTNLEKYPKMAEFIVQRIIGLKGLLDKYVEGVQERLRKHWPSMQYALKLDITKERAEIVAKLYELLHEGIKENKYHVVLEEFKRYQEVIEKLNTEKNELKDQLEIINKRREKITANGTQKIDDKGNNLISISVQNVNPFNMFRENEDKDDKKTQHKNKF